MLNYRIVLTYLEEKDQFKASAPELEQCEVEAATRSEALAQLEEEIAARLENMKSQGIEPPQPIDQQEFDGKLSVTVSSTLHRELTFLAELEKVELEALVVELLTRSVAPPRYSQQRGGKGEGRKGRPREGQGRRYHDIMENRADFIEYVRGLDKGGGGGGGGSRRGGRKR